MKNTYTFLAMTTLTVLSLSNSLSAQNFPNYAAYGTGEDTSNEKTPKTPPANFFPGNKSSTNFFENKSVTPELVSPDRKVIFGTDRYSIPTNTSAPTAVPEEAVNTDQEKPNVDSESWSTSKNDETDEVKNLKQNIDQASEQSSDDPRIQEVLAQSKKIKEALFGKTSTQKSDTPKSTVANKSSGKVTKEIERF